ncbi:type I secretion C-terminal target domain-containing protein (plasmid) [Tistrella mobilis]|uniref:beta strand repeat-containing protein n=1 Tax=Tistrella mobilis TaxID=171437 RepID=UPI003557F09E
MPPYNFIDGTSGDDVLNGTEDADQIVGHGGSDIIYGNGGDDRLFGGGGMDEPSDHDTVYGGDGNDTITGGGGSNELFGEAGDDVITGGKGDDVIHGGDGDDTLDGSTGTNVIDGGDGIDTFTFSGRATTVDLAAGTATAGTNTSNTLISIENVLAGSYSDNISGNDGVNRLAGGGGNDVIDGGGGDDIIIGGANADTLIGGAGADTFVYEATSDSGALAQNRDTIMDFNAAEGDRIDLSAIDANTDLIGNQAFSFIGAAAFSRTAGELRYVAQDAGYLIQADTDGDGYANFSILLDDQQTAPTAGAFILGTSEGEPINGTAGDDVLTGTAEIDNIFGLGGNDRLEGLAGADQIDGGDGIDTAVYTSSAEAVTIDLYTGNNTGGDAEGDVLVSIENVAGSAHDDTFISGIGANGLDGGDGIDTVIYRNSSVEMTVDLEAGTGTGGLAAGDTLTSIENLTSTSNSRVIFHGDDGVNHLTGGAGNDILQGRGGADVLDGGDGRDNAYYTDSAEGVSVDLTLGTASGGDAEGDTLISIENLTGSAFNDQLRGDDGYNILRGGAGDDVLDGGLSGDVLEGGLGFDTASYENSSVGVTVSLSTGRSLNGDAAGDSFSSIEGLRGSAFNDVFSGDAKDNRLSGGDGDDALRGRTGADILEGGNGADRFVYGSTADSTRDLAGRDTIIDFSRTDGDRIDLSEIDADRGTAGNQAFTFIAYGAYSGTAGEVRIGPSDGGLVVAADTDGDKVSDLVIFLEGVHGLTASDFIL